MNNQELGVSPEVGKLPPEFKAKWLEALRSGKYKQGTGSLRRKDKYCVLGVLAVVTGYIKEKENVCWENLKALLGEETFWEICWMNDHPKCMSFLEIADWIEINL